MQRIQTLIHRIALLLLCAAAITRVSPAQVYSGTLTGIVTDPAGAAVPDAALTLTDENKGFTFTTKTGQDGRFVLRNLAPGTYRLDATSGGMRPYRRPNIVLSVGQNAEANITFELAGTQQSVEVTAASPSSKRRMLLRASW